MNAIQYLLLALILLTASCKNEALNHDEEVADLNEIGIELPIANSAKKSKIHHQVFLTIGNNDYHHEGYPKTEKLTDIKKSLSLEYKKMRKGSPPFLSLIATGDILNTLHAAGFRKIIFTSYEDKPQRPRRGFHQNKLSPSATPIAPPFKNLSLIHI